MLRDYHYIWRSLFILVDLSISALAFLVAYWLRFLPPLVNILGAPPAPPPIGEYCKVLPVLCALQWITSSSFKLYHPRRTSSFLDELADIVRSTLMAVLFLMAIFFFIRHFSFSRSIVVIFAALNPIALILFRLSVRTSLRSLRARGYNLRRILIVGTGRPAQALIHRIRSNPWTGICIQGIVSLTHERVGTKIHGVPVIGCVEALDGVLERYPADHAYLALPPRKRKLTEGLADVFTDRLIAVRVVPDIGYFCRNGQLADFEGLPVVSVWEDRLSGWSAFVKRAMDVVIAAVGIVACAPLFVLIAAIVKLTSSGPVFYTQKRMGLDGRLFPILKFRTMHCGAEEGEGWTVPGDDRCTPFGRFLRRTSLDELPQLFNVIVGQMSLVGPRPERPVLIEQFRKKLPHYMARHQFKAGMTGWAQVNGWRGNTSLRKRLQYDLYYQRHWSVWFDLKILALTLVRGLVHPNAY